MKLPSVVLPVLVFFLSAAIYLHCTVAPVSDSDYQTHISNKVVLICDVGSAGEQFAYELAKQGAKLLLVARTGRSESRLRTLKDGKLASPQAQLQISANTKPMLLRIKETALKLGSPQVEIETYDFGDVAGAHTLVDKTVELLGGLDYLVLNEEEVPRGFLLQFHQQQTPDFINRSFRVNVFSFIEIALKAMPHLEESKGHIFVTSSTLGEVPNAGLSVYSATKHALNGFFYSLQQELIAKKSSVSLTIGALGVIRTEDKMPLLKLPDWQIGDLMKCARGMMDSLISRPKTFTYPKIYSYMTRFMWYFLPN